MHQILRDLLEPFIAEKRQEMTFKLRSERFQITRVSLALRQQGAFLQEMLRRFRERLAGNKKPRTAFAPQTKIPILGNIFCMCQAIFPGRASPVPSVDIRSALPFAAILPAINVEFASH